MTAHENETTYSTTPKGASAVDRWARSLALTLVGGGGFRCWTACAGTVS